MTIGHVSDGTDADPDQYNDLADAVNNLLATTATTGGTVGTSSLDANEGWREETGQLSENGRVTVTHNLGFTPRVQITMRGTGGPYLPYVLSPTSTQFTVVFYKIDGTGGVGAEGQTVIFDWQGKKGDSV